VSAAEHMANYQAANAHRQGKEQRQEVRGEESRRHAANHRRVHYWCTSGSV